jgi:hypothetical protein
VFRQNSIFFLELFFPLNNAAFSYIRLEKFGKHFSSLTLTLRFHPDQTNWSGSDMYLIWKFERYLVCSSIGILVKLRSKTSIFPDQIWRFLIGVWPIHRSDFNIKSDQQNIKCLVGIASFHSGMKIFGFGSEKSEFPELEKCLPYFSNPDIEENR